MHPHAFIVKIWAPGATPKWPQTINLTFTALPGRTHYVQACDLTFQFTDLSGPIVNAGSVALPTNYLGWNALTNDPARFYRLRIVD